MRNGFLACLAMVILLAAGAAQAETIVLVADEWCPYNCEPGSDKPGFIVEVAQKVFGGAGRQVQYEIIPWSRAVDKTREGEFTAAIGATTEDAEGFVFPKEEFGQVADHYFKRKGYPWTYNGIDSLKEVHLGYIADYDYGEDVNAYIEANQGTDKVQAQGGESPLETNIKKLLAERIDVLIEDKNVAMYMAKQMGVADQVEHAGSDKEFDPIYLAFSPANPKSQEYADMLDKAVQDMRASGELAKILDKYGLKDWK